MPKKEPFLEIRVRLKSAEQKALFQEAADQAKPLPLKLTNWLIIAALEKAERDGVTPGKRKGGG